MDTKPSIQARRRRSTGPPLRGQPMRVDHEYQRNGALALLAALDMHTGTVPAAATPPTIRIAHFMGLMSQVMSQEPFASAPQVFVIVDNGSDHRGEKAAGRLRAAWARHHDPHAGAHVLTELSFTSRYNQTARPFNWKYTKADLAGTLEQISVREQPQETPSLPQAT